MNRVGNFRVVPRMELDAMAARAREGEYVPAGLRPKESVRFERLRKLEEWLDHERLRSAEGRYQMALDEDFYDGLQWSQEDAQTLRERGQAPLVYNKIQTSVKWVTGTEKRTRIDFRVYPRSKDDRGDAENKTKLLKYLGDVNKAAFARSRAFADAAKVGIGWLECGIRGDPTQELLYTRYENWRNMLYDSHSTEMDLRDGRYVFRQRWTDVDIAKAMFPKFADRIASQATSSQIADVEDAEEWYLGERLAQFDQQGSFIPARTFVDTADYTINRRERVRLYEGWYRFPHAGQYFIGGPMHGLLYDPSDDIHNWIVRRDDAVSVIERVALRMRAAVFIRGTLLDDILSPYRFNDFPFTPIWGNRRGRDGQPYGMVRQMRDPQESLNKRMSKALFVMSTRRVVMDKGAVDDIDDLRDEAARPDGIIEKNKGFELDLHTDTDIAEEHLKYAQIDMMMIEHVGGVTDENLGRKTNATSGIAIEKRQDQGTTVTTDYFDNLRFSTQSHGQKELSLTEQFYTFEKTLRILGDRQGYDFTTINRPGKDPQTGEETVLDDITRSQADFIVGAQDFRETLRIAAYEQLMDMIGKIAAQGPEGLNMALRMLDDVLEFADIPGIELLIKTIREATGKRPADEPMTPEEQQAAEQQKAQEAAKQQAAEQISMQAAVAEVQERLAKIRKLQAETAKIESEVAAGQTGVDPATVAKLREDTAKLVDQLRERVRKAEFAAAVAKLSSADKRAIAELGAAESIEVATIAAAAKIGAIDAKAAHDSAAAADEFAREQFAARSEQAHEVGMANMEMGHAAGMAAAEREHSSAEAQREREHASAEAAETRSHQASEAQRSRGHETRGAREQRSHETKQQTRQLSVQTQTAKLNAGTKKATAKVAKPAGKPAPKQKR